MELRKTGSAAAFVQEDFVFSDKTVQGARLGKRGDDLFVCSQRRFKLFSEGVDEVHFLEGNGHFKWARGETDFAAGDAFRVAQAGEYEVNGKCTFVVLRNKI